MITFSILNQKGLAMSATSCSHDDRPRTELTQRKPTMDDVRRAFRFRSSEFECLDLPAAELLHAIACTGGWALVIGDPANAAYEWVYVRCDGQHFVGPTGYVPRAEEDEEWSTSNRGFGCDASALLDVLLHVEGTSCRKCGCCVLPEEIDIRCRHCLAADEPA